MEFFLNYLHQKVPQADKSIPGYYRRALTSSEVLLVVYFIICFFLFPLINNGRWEWSPLVFALLSGCCLWMLKRGGVRINLIKYAVVSIGWVCWNVRYFGWNSGVQHMMTLILVFVFFNVYDKPVNKLLWFLAVLLIRVGLFYVSQQFPALYNMGTKANTIYQTLNTIAFFLMLTCTCIIFSTSIQETERQLRLRNQILYKEAGTDSLTGLPNRRLMIEQIEQYCVENRNQTFCVAIADLDYFKQVNDTYGHKCGDYVLMRLTKLFTEHAMERYSACRWGGEEFCFFMPEMNLDQAGIVMNDLCSEVRKMNLLYEGNEFSITLSIGVEEYDFASSLDELLDAADDKLYKAKNAGRNRVVV